MEFRTLAEIGAHMTYLLRKREKVEDPRYRGGLLSWLLNEDGWMTPVWTHLTFYSGENDIIRFRNDLVTRLPKSQWPHREPKQFRFEMTACIDELEPELLNEVIDYCNLARRQPKAGFDRHPPRFQRDQIMAVTAGRREHGRSKPKDQKANKSEQATPRKPSDLL